MKGSNNKGSNTDRDSKHKILIYCVVTVVMPVALKFLQMSQTSA